MNTLIETLKCVEFDQYGYEQEKNNDIHGSHI